MDSKQKHRNQRCAPRLRDLLERWRELDGQAREEKSRAIEAKFEADQRIHNIEMEMRWCVLDMLRFLEMTD